MRDAHSIMRDKINAGAYINNDPYPKRPTKPILLDAEAGNLTDDQLLSIPKLRAEYEAARGAYFEATKVWNAKDAALEEQFRTDLEEAFAMRGHPKAGPLWEKAWDRGHAHGLQEVLNEYDDLIDLVR